MRTFLSVAMVLGSSQCIFCQLADQPVPTKWVHDGRLEVPDFNFLIDSPNSDSHWSYQQLPNIQGHKATAFSVDSSPTEDYGVIVWESGSGGRMDDPASKKRFIDGMQGSLPKGWQADGFPRMERSEIPMSGSWKIHTAVRRPADGFMLFAYFYIITGKRTYMLIDYSPETSEPLKFNRFVKSFALVSPSANSIPSQSDPVTGIMLVLALVEAVVDWRYKRRGGVRPTMKHRMYFWSGMLLCYALIIAAGINGASAEAIGRLAVSVLIYFFAVWEGGRWLIRRKNPLPSPIPPTP